MLNPVELSQTQLQRLSRAWEQRWHRAPSQWEIETIRALVATYAVRMRTSKAITHAVAAIQTSASIETLMQRVGARSDRASWPATSIRRDVEPDGYLLSPNPVGSFYYLHPVRRSAAALWMLPSPSWPRGKHQRLEQGQLFLLVQDVPDEHRPVPPESRLTVPISSPLLNRLVDASALPDPITE